MAGATLTWLGHASFRLDSPGGDHFTMGPTGAAVALELLGNPRRVPCHYGTFALLTGTPEQLREAAANARVESLQPGDSVTL